ncbi:MAG: squalene/phytoene synthase family protein [Bacteroidales bacterium]|jgi:phytoene/squalene synthetase
MNQETRQYLELFNQIDFQQIKDHPNILIAARFWDEERYGAARVCYRFMRAIDDFIDDHKAANRVIHASERNRFERKVKDWLGAIRENSSAEPFRQELIDTMRRFKIPMWPMEQFARAMIYDICNDGYNTLDDFIAYSQGASVAPSSVFVHLCGIRKRADVYAPPLFNVKEAATPCAMFSYLVHTIRDFQKDQRNNLNCFAGNLMARHGLTREDLRGIAHGGKIPQGFRDLISDYLQAAEAYRIQTLEVIRRINPFLEPRYRLSLQIIFNLYLMVYERIDPNKGTFTMEELNPTPDEIRQRVLSTITAFEPALA